MTRLAERFTGNDRNERKASMTIEMPETLTAADGKTTLHRTLVLAAHYGGTRQSVEGAIERIKIDGFDRTEILDDPATSAQAAARAIEWALSTPPENPHPDDGLPRNLETLEKIDEAVTTTLAIAAAEGLSLVDLAAALVRRAAESAEA